MSTRETYPEDCRRLSDAGCKLFIMASMAQAEGKDEVAPGEPGGLVASLADIFPVQVILKRVEVMKLPIQFTFTGLLGITALTTSPGEVVLALIECLNAYEGKQVSIREIADLYPWGFYNQDKFEAKVKELVEDPDTRCKWAGVW